MSENKEQIQKNAYLILRITLGMTLFTFGVNKVWIQGAGIFSGNIMENFDGLIPYILLLPFAYSLPYVELVIGALIIAGFKTYQSITAYGILIAMLIFGAIMAGNPVSAANNLNYALIIFFLLWNIDKNSWCLDALISKS